MGRGLYGQNEGNEARDGVAQLVDQIADNEVCEKDVVDPLKALWQSKEEPHGTEASQAGT